MQLYAHHLNQARLKQQRKGIYVNLSTDVKIFCLEDAIKDHERLDRSSELKRAGHQTVAERKAKSSENLDVEDREIEDEEEADQREYCKMRDNDVDYDSQDDAEVEAALMLKMPRSTSKRKVKLTLKASAKVLAATSTKQEAPHKSLVIDADADDFPLPEVEENEWATLMDRHGHVNNSIIDDYMELLVSSLSAKDTVIFSSTLWHHMMIATPADFRDNILQHKICGRDGTRFRNKTRLIWPIVGRDHFAVLDINNESRAITVYDSLTSTARGWIPARSKGLKRLVAILAVAFPGVSFNVQYGVCSDQMNSHDCGVYCMANVRSLVSHCPIAGPASRMPVVGWTADRREKRVMELRRQFKAELASRTLHTWW